MRASRCELAWARETGKLVARVEFMRVARSGNGNVIRIDAICRTREL